MNYNSGHTNSSSHLGLAIPLCGYYNLPANLGGLPGIETLGAFKRQQRAKIKKAPSELFLFRGGFFYLAPVGQRIRAANEGHKRKAPSELSFQGSFIEAIANQLILLASPTGFEPVLPA